MDMVCGVGCVHAAVSVMHAWLMDGCPDQRERIEAEPTHLSSPSTWPPLRLLLLFLRVFVDSSILEVDDDDAWLAALLNIDDVELELDDSCEL